MHPIFHSNEPSSISIPGGKSFLAIISLISETFTLHPGDVIATGTPEGVGYARTPQWLLQPGDTVQVEIEKLGTLTTPVGDISLRSRA